MPARKKKTRRKKKVGKRGRRKVRRKVQGRRRKKRQQRRGGIKDISCHQIILMNGLDETFSTFDVDGNELTIIEKLLDSMSDG